MDENRKRPIWRHQLAFRLLLSILLLVVGFAWWIGSWTEGKIESLLRNDVRAEARALAENQIAGLKTLMVHGDGQLVSEWMERMDQQQDIDAMRIYRRNGEQAFADLKTVQAVNDYLGGEVFHRVDTPQTSKFSPKTEDIRQAASGVTQWREESGDYIQLLMPIHRDDECLRCHGYEDDLVRGVLYVRLSTGGEEQAIHDFRHNAMIFTAFFALLLLLAVGLLLHRLVLAPMDALLESIQRLIQGKGQGHTALPVQRDDEFGVLARSFVELEDLWMLRERRLQLVLQHIPDGVLTVDANGAVLSGNQAASDMLGIAPDQLQQCCVLESLYPPARSKRKDVPSLAEIGVASLAETVRECVAQSSDHGLFPLELEVRPFHVDYMLFMRERAMYDLDKHGRFLVFLRDLTIRKRAEGEMRLLSAVVNQATDAILITDPAGVIEYVNTAFCRITQYTREEVTGKKPSLLKSGEYDSDYYQKMWQDLLQGKVWKDVFVNRRKDGSSYHAEQTIAPIFDAYGHISHLVSIQRDITRERDLQAQMEHLQRLESLGVLASGIAHDFNNILAVVMGNAELLMMDLDDASEQKPSFEAIISASNRGAALCHELMAYAGKGRRDVQWVNLKTMVDELNHLLQVTVPKHIRMSFDFDDDLPEIRADAMQLEQVMMNLLINAREAIDQEAGHIHIRARERTLTKDELQGMYYDQLPESMHFIHLQVEDDGCGMSDEVKGRIFDPFYTTKFTGRGLGMSAVLGIVQGHRGAMSCQSVVGKGTCFNILLPIDKDEESSQTIESLAESSHMPDGKTILVVEDEDAVRDVLQHMLSRAGCHVHAYADGEEALRNFRDHQDHIDLLMLDMSMPNMNGATLLRILQGEGLNVPVVLCSGEPREDVLQQVQGLHVDAVVAKPFQYQSLLYKLAELLSTTSGS